MVSQVPPETTAAVQSTCSSPVFVTENEVVPCIYDTSWFPGVTTRSAKLSVIVVALK